MESKLAALIDRLETVVKRAEQQQGPSQAPATPQATNALVSEWQKDVASLCAPFKAAADALNVAQVTTVSQQFVSLVHLQTAVFVTMAKFGQPADFSFLTARNAEIITAASLVKQKDFKAPPNHLQTVIDGMQMFVWPFFQGDALKESMKDFFEQISFYGNKVLKLDKEPDTKWFTAFKDLNAAILAFILKKMSTISTWAGKEDPSGAQAYFDSIAEAAMSGQTLAAPVTASVSVSAHTASTPSSGLADSYRSSVTAQLAPLKQAATALSIAQVSTATDMFCELIEEQALLFALQAKYSKPADLKVLGNKKQQFFDAASLVKQKDFKAPPNHIGIVIDSMNLFGSALLPADDSAKEFLKEIYDSLPFLGNKILKMEKP